jgi:hypothetical protein
MFPRFMETRQGFVLVIVIVIVIGIFEDENEEEDEHDRKAISVTRHWCECS